MTESLKTYLIDSYCNLIQLDKFDLDHSKLVLITSLGTIYGKIFKLDKSNAEKTVINQVNEAAEKQYFKYNKEISGNDEYICLEDVLLVTPKGDKVKFTHLNVFYDQVIGVTVGNYSQELESN